MSQTAIFLVLAGFVLAVGLGAYIIPHILFISYKKQLFDKPDERKVHRTPVPRLGGLSFFPVVFICFGFLSYLAYDLRASISISGEPTDILFRYVALMIGLMILYLTGMADDIVGVGYKGKFAMQILVSLLLVGTGTCLDTLGGFLGIYLIPKWVGVLLTVFLVIYITNAINLIDGIDGLASGLCLIALFTLTGINVIKDIFFLSLLGACTFGVIVPFWFYNVFGDAKRKHKIFMGDTGSLTLGLILSFIVINMCRTQPGSARGINNLIEVAFSTLIVPLFDVVRVVIHRIRHGRNPFKPDKNHFHHKLLRTGMNARWSMVTIILFCLFFIVLNALMAKHVNITYILLTDVIVWCVFHVVLTLLGNKRMREREEAQKAAAAGTAQTKEARKTSKPTI